MAKLFGILLTITLLLSFPAAPAGLTITVRVYDYARTPSSTVNQARKIATEIYRHAGIETLWVDCPKDLQDTGSYPACQNSLGARDFVLKILPRAVPELTNENCALGMAALSGRGGFAAYIFFDRVENLTWDELRPATDGVFAGKWPIEMLNAVTLGVAMAHELGHLLLGPGSHARDGIMRPSWSRKNLEEAFSGNSRFTGAQISQLQGAVAARVLAQRAD
jgi:hypothetical protein